MKQEASLMDYIADFKTSLTSSLSITIYSFSHVSNEWYVIDSWAEIGVIVGTMLSIANFLVYLYDRFWRNKVKKGECDG